MNADELKTMTVDELRYLARQKNISGRGEMNKAQLVEALASLNLSARVEALEERVASLEAVIKPPPVHPQPPAI